jgi:carboxypeptidase Taq
MNAYDRLKHRFTRIATIGEASAMLNWDAAAVMPSGGGAARADQLAVLAGLSHGLLVATEVSDELAAAAELPLHDEWDIRNLALMQHAHRRATALPADLIEAQERANSVCEKVWRQARADNDFAAVLPYLAEVLSLTCEAASALGPALGLAPYDALMDGYQPGIAAADVDPIFNRYETFLAEFLPQVEALQSCSPPPTPMTGVFPAERQEGVCRMLSRRLGLEPEHSRLDRSTHPFCGGTSTDVRITTRYDEADPEMALLGVLHETGHALYERGLPGGAYARQPVGQAAGMAAHESQSLIIEMQACRSDRFLTWLGPELHRTFGGTPEAFTPGNLARLWRRVERGFIRVDADEITYPAHVILRFRLERALVAGDLPVSEIPVAWAEQMRSLLGVIPPDDRRGCLQDIHWFDGAFGYFPSYTLGAMAAAQLMAAARDEEPGLEGALEQGDLHPLTSWLRRRVHAQGSRYGFNALLESATGAVLDPALFETYLRRRYA